MDGYERPLSENLSLQRTGRLISLDAIDNKVAELADYWFENYFMTSGMTYSLSCLIFVLVLYTISTVVQEIKNTTRKHQEARNRKKVKQRTKRTKRRGR